MNDFIYIDRFEQTKQYSLRKCCEKLWKHFEEENKVPKIRMYIHIPRKSYAKVPRETSIYIHTHTHIAKQNKTKKEITTDDLYTNSNKRIIHYENLKLTSVSETWTTST